MDKPRPHYDPTQWPWVRTCQACDKRVASANEPKDKSTNSYMYRKCISCGSEAFDHGSRQPFTAVQIAEYDAFEKWENEQGPEYWGSDAP